MAFVGIGPEGEIVSFKSEKVGAKLVQDAVIQVSGKGEIVTKFGRGNYCQ